jgi:hypothetical protein
MIDIRNARCRSRNTAFVALFLLTGGCAAAESNGLHVERTDSAGVLVVTTFGPDAPPPLRLEKIFDLGGADSGPEAFVRVHPTSVGADSDGRLYVLDAGTFSVTIFDRDGEVVRSFGRRGGGPGEFDFPTDLAVTPDGRVGVYDFGVRGLVRFNPDGSVLPSIEMPGTTRKFALHGDRVIGAFRSATASADSTQQRVLDFAPADTITLFARNEPQATSINVGCMRIGLPPIYTQDIAWGANPQRTVIADPVTYSIRVFENGRQTAEWRRNVATIETTPDFAAVEVGGDSMRFQAGPNRCAISAREAVESIGYAPFVPLIRDLLVAPDGRVFAERRTLPGQTLIDIFATDGAYLGTLPAGTPFPAAFRSSDELVTVEQDSLELRHVNVYRLVQAPS